MHLSRHQVLKQIASVEYIVVVPKQTTVAVVLLHSGQCIIGESHCLNPENFTVEAGEVAAMADAEKKIWPIIANLVRTIDKVGSLKLA